MDTASAFLPLDRRRALVSGSPLPDRVRGAALFVDISGFTPLTAALAQELGPALGAEEVIDQLNRVYAAIIAEVHRFHGDVIAFSGDAITCWFEETMEDVDMVPPASRRAVACGLALQQTMTRHRAVTTPSGLDIPLGVKVAVAAGPARRFLAGDPEQYLIEVLAGATLDRMAAAEKRASRGEVVVSSEVAEQIGPELKISEWRHDGLARYAVIAALADDPAPPTTSRTIPAHAIPVIDHQIARPWLLPPVYAHLQVASDAFLAGLRPSVSLFLRFSGINYDEDDHAGQKLDAFIRGVQTILKRYDGYLIQITMGDKGSYLYISFGAPIAHENDAARAAAAALALRALPDAYGFLNPPQLGISSGLVHSGAYGSPERRTFGVIGSEVNISARLMSAARPGQVLVSAPMADELKADYHLTTLPPVRLKGVEEPFIPWELIGPLAHRVEAVQQTPASIVGRKAELALVEQALARLLEGHSTCLLIEGPPGVGKSLLIRELLRQAQAVGEERVLTFVGGGDAIEQSTSYYAWRPILEKALGLGSPERVPGTAESVEAGLLSRLEPEYHRFIPLLNAVLPLGLPDSELTEQMTGEARQENTQRLLIEVLNAAFAGRRPILIFDDAHWLDSVSWALLQRVQEQITPLLLVLVSRPMVDGVPAAYLSLRENPNSQILALDSLPHSAIEELVRTRLGARRLSRAVARLIVDKAEGNPFFSEELAYALRDARLIEIVEGEVRLTAGEGSLEALGFPNTIQGIITSRIDLLPPQQQLTVKVASVIGRIFAFRLLRDVYPLGTNEGQLRQNLNELERRAITSLEVPEPQLAYIFKHIVTQEVVYSLMTFAQRQQLHRGVAVWMEAAGEGDRGQTAPLLAHHWRQAGDIDRAIPYYEKAGEIALRDFANQEALRFLGQAAELAGDRYPAIRRAQWHRLMGEAAYRLTYIEQSRTHYTTALRLMGLPTPTSSPRNALGLVGELLRQTSGRLRPRLSSPERQPILLEASRAYEEIAELYYNEGDMLATFRCVMASLNLADRAGPSPELARGYANMVATLGTASLNSMAEGYRSRAVSLADSLNDPSTTAAIQVPLASYSLWIGAWDRVEQESARALSVYAELGEWRKWGVVAWLLPQAAQSRGDLASAGELWAELSATADRNRDTRHQVRGRGGQFFNYLSMGRDQDAAAVAESIAALLRDNPEIALIEERLWYGIQASQAMDRAEWQVARALAHEQIAAIGRARFKFDLLEVLAGPADVLLSLWERNVATAEEARRGCRVLDGYARTYPFARPRALRYRGRATWLSGKPGAARKLWQKSLAQAAALGMPYERALTLAELGRLTGDAAAAAEGAAMLVDLGVR